MAESKRREPDTFESNDFVQECLDAFDASIALIEKDYAITSKSA